MAFRTVAHTFHLRRSELGFLAAEIYESIPTSKIQAIWQWDLDATGGGNSDEELDQSFLHLALRNLS